MEQSEKTITQEAAFQRKNVVQQRRLAIEQQVAAPSGSTFRVINADAASAADKERRRADQETGRAWQRGRARRTSGPRRLNIPRT